VSGASARAGGELDAKVQVSDGLTSTGDPRTCFRGSRPATRRADASVWQDQDVDPSSHHGQAWNVFMSQWSSP